MLGGELGGVVGTSEGSKEGSSDGTGVGGYLQRSNKKNHLIHYYLIIKRKRLSEYGQNRGQMILFLAEL